METLATLTLDINVRSAEPAEAKLADLTRTAKAAEDQFLRTGAAQRDFAVAQGLSGTAAGKAIQNVQGLVQVYGAARDSLGRFTKEDGSFRLSQEATAKVLLQNARTVEAYGRQQDQAAKVVAKAEADAARAANVTFQLRSRLTKQRVAEEQAALAEIARAEQAAADMERTLAERNAAFRASMLVKQTQDAQAAAEAEVAAITKAAAEVMRAWKAEAEMEATLLERNAALRANLIIQQVQDEERARAVATKAASDMEARVKALTASYSPLENQMERTNKELAEAKGLFDAGAISQEKYGAATTVLNARLATLKKQQAEAAAGAKLHGYEMLNLTRQATDFGVQVLSGQGFLMPLIQQGPQVADVFQQAALRGVGFKTALAGIAAEVGPVLAIAAPLAAIVGLLALGTQRALETDAAVRSFSGQLALNVDGLNYNASALASTSKELSKYGLSAKDAAAGLSTFIGAGVDADKLKDFSVAAKSLSEVSPAFRDIKSAQDAVSTAFTGGFDAVQKLDEQLNFLTVDQYKHIKSQYDSGHASEAQAEAFAAFAAKVDDAADKARGPWETAVRDLTSAWSDFLDTLANSDAIQSTVSELSKLIGVAQGGIKLISDYNKAKANEDNAYLDSVAAGRPKDALGLSTNQLGIWSRIGLGENAISAILDPFDQTGDAIRSRQLSALGASTAAMVAPKQTSSDSQSEKAYVDLMDQLTLQLDQAKKINDEERKRLAGEKAVNTAISKHINDETWLGNIRSAARELEQTKIDKERAAAARSSNSATNRALRQDDATQDALDRAAKAELTARQALTSNIDMLARFRLDEIAQDATAAKANVDREVGMKKIDATLAPALKASIDRTAALKSTAVNQQLAAQMIDKEVQQRSTLAGLNGRTLQAQLGMATSLEEQQAVEGKILAARQAQEWADAKAQERKEQLAGTYDAEAAKAANGARMEAQAAETAAKAQSDRVALFRQGLQVEQARYQNAVDALQSEQGLAQSNYQAAQLERQIENAQYAARKDLLAKTIANLEIPATERAMAAGDLATLEQVHANHLKALDLSDSMVSAYSDVVQALAGLAGDIQKGDVGSSLSSLSSVLKQFSGLTAASNPGLSDNLAKFASYAGPVGQAVSAVTSVLGAIGQSSAEKAQKKLDDLNKSVEALRTSNKESSGSIAGALDKANANWNSDLEYSNQMLTALRSIDNQIGTLASSIARSISTGDLLSTAGLGLGTTKSGASNLLNAIGGLLMGQTKKTTELLDQGLNFNATTFGDLANGGITGSTYADLATTKVKKLFGVAYSTKVSTSTVNGSIDGDLLGQITGVIEALGKGVLTAATAFGDDAAEAARKALEGAQIDLGKLSLKGLSSSEIADVLNATFSKVGDQLAAAGVPGLEQLADVGEGAFETLTRLSREYTVVDVALKSIGMTFKTMGVESLAARDNLVKLFGGMDEFTSATSFFASNFLTDAEQLAPVIKAVNDNLAQFGLSADSTREQFKNLVLGLDVSTESGAAAYKALLSIAPAFDKVADAAEAATKAQEEAAQAAADASQKAAEGYLSYLQKVSDDATKAQEQQASALQTVNAALSQTITNLNDLTKSLNAFADSLGFGDLAANDLGTQYDLAKQALASAKGDQIPAAAQAFLAIAKEHASTGLAYSQDVAFAQSVARGGAQAAQDDIAALKAFAPLYQALMSGNQAEFDKLVRGDLPGFANGGMLTIGGNSGVDNNLLSINGQPQAWVSSGEGLGIFPRGRGGANDNDMAAVVTELKALRQQVADLQATNQRAADNTGDTSDYLRNGVVATTGA